MSAPHLARTLLLCVFAAPICAQMPGHWSTYLGGNQNDEQVHAIATAGNGDIVVAGHTHSNNFKTTSGVYQPKTGGFKDAFIVRLAADGRRLLAATHLGGSHHEVPSWVHVAADGTIWVGGTTHSPNFPVTANTYMQPTQFRTDAFVTQFDAGLTKVLYSTVFGGSQDETGDGFVLDAANNHVYIAGTTAGSVPTTSNAVQSTARPVDCYLAVLSVDSKSTTLKYATLLGGSGHESSVDALSLQGSLVTMTGTTQSTDFPITSSALQTTAKGSKSAFVTTIDPRATGTKGLVYSSYVCGAGTDRTLRHLTSASGLIHLLLLSDSQDLPVTQNALQSKAGGKFDLFYAQLDPTKSGSSGLVYGSWLVAGGDNDGIFGGNICVGLAPTTGGVAVCAAVGPGSSSLPRTQGAFQTRWSTTTGQYRGYALSLDLTGTKPAIGYATLYHGCSQVLPSVVGQHTSGDLLLAGFANGAPVMRGVVQEQPASSQDAFVSRLPTSARPLSFRTFGSACQGTNGLPRITVGLPAQLCQHLRVDVSNLPRNQRGFFIFGSQTAPISFESIGATGCSVVVSPIVFLFIKTGSNGFSATFPVPGDHRLLGQEVAMQYIFTDPGANPLGAALTQGLAVKGRW